MGVICTVLVSHTSGSERVQLGHLGRSQFAGYTRGYNHVDHC
jgi:hypothetical protein